MLINDGGELFPPLCAIGIFTYLLIGTLITINWQTNKTIH